MPIFPSCNISGLNIIEPTRSPEVPPRTNSSSVAIAILVPFFALIFAGFGFYLYKQRWVQFHQWNYWWKKIGKCASWWSFPSHLIAGSLIKRSTAAALCMKTTTVRLHSRIPCTTPIPNPSRARSSASIPISIRFAQWFEGLMLSERSLLCGILLVLVSSKQLSSTVWGAVLTRGFAGKRLFFTVRVENYILSTSHSESVDFV